MALHARHGGELVRPDPHVQLHDGRCRQSGIGAEQLLVNAGASCLVADQAATCVNDGEFDGASAVQGDRYGLVQGQAFVYGLHQRLLLGQRHLDVRRRDLQLGAVALEEALLHRGGAEQASFGQPGCGCVGLQCLGGFLLTGLDQPVHPGFGVLFQRFPKCQTIPVLGLEALLALQDGVDGCGCTGEVVDPHHIGWVGRP